MVAGLTLFAAMEAEHTSMHAINQYLLIFLVLFTIVTHFLILFASSHLTLLFNTIQSFWQRRKQQRAKDLLYRLTHLLSHHHSSFLTVKTEYDKAYEPYDLEFDSIVRAELDVLSTSQPSPSVNPTTNPLPAPKEIQAPHELTHPAGSPPPSPFKQFNDTWPPTQEANTPINETPLPSTDDMQPVPNSRDDYEL